MNARELFYEGGETAGEFQCGKCRLRYHRKETADHCCGGRLCGCGKTAQQWRELCCECAKRASLIKEAKDEAERFGKARKLTEGEWDGWVFCDKVEHPDGYFESTSELREWCEDMDQEMPDYVWSTKSNPVCHLDKNSILEDATQEAWEGFDYDSDLDGVSELVKALEAFNEANEGKLIYHPDSTMAVLLNSIANESN